MQKWQYSKALVFLKQVENTIRWRIRRDEEGNEIKESNARIVKWSDGRWAQMPEECGNIQNVAGRDDVLQ